MEKVDKFIEEMLADPDRRAYLMVLLEAEGYSEFLAKQEESDND